MPKHSSSDGFQDGVPGICNECFLKQKPSKQYHCEHNHRLAVLIEGCWKTSRDALNEAGHRARPGGTTTATSSATPNERLSTEQQRQDKYRQWLSRENTLPAKRSPPDASIYSWRGYNNWADKVYQTWKVDEPVDS